MEYISKNALVAEIEKLVDKDKYHDYYQCAYRDGNNSALYALKEIIGTLEVKKVDLEKELENLIEKEKAFVADNREVKYYNGDSFNHIYELEFIAKHFFELGMRVNNPITAADRGKADEIILALNTLGEEKMISYDKEIEWLNKLKKL